MHGGADGSGAQKGNRNAYRHGLFTAEMILSRREANRVLREGYGFLKEFDEDAF